MESMTTISCAEQVIEWIEFQELKYVASKHFQTPFWLYSGDRLWDASPPSAFPCVCFHAQKIQACSPVCSHSISKQKMLTQPKSYLWPCLCTDTFIHHLQNIQFECESVTTAFFMFPISPFLKSNYRNIYLLRGISHRGATKFPNLYKCNIFPSLFFKHYFVWMRACVHKFCSVYFTMASWFSFQYLTD